MAEVATPSGDSSPEIKSPPKRQSNPTRTITIFILLLGILLYTYSVFADRLTPYTDQATVQAYVVRVAPDVSGRVMSVNVADNQIAKTDEVLFAIDPERFQIAVDIAEAKLASVGLNIGASTAALAAAEARLAEAEAKFVNIAATDGARLRTGQERHISQGERRSGAGELSMRRSPMSIAPRRKSSRRARIWGRKAPTTRRSARRRRNCAPPSAISPIRSCGRRPTASSPICN